MCETRFRQNTDTRPSKEAFIYFFPFITPAVIQLVRTLQRTSKHITLPDEVSSNSAGVYLHSLGVFEIPFDGGFDKY